MDLLRLIERHSEELTTRLIQAIRKHPEMAYLAKEQDIELRQWTREVLECLRLALSGSPNLGTAALFENFGRLRYEEQVPLHEAVLRLNILKDKIIALVDEQGFPMTAPQLYAEEQFERRIARFFDAAVYRIVRGYEEARRLEMRIAS